MKALPTLEGGERRRLFSTVALLTSPVDGERLAASYAVERLLIPLGISVVDVFRAALEPSPELRRPADVPFGARRYSPNPGSLRSQHVQLARKCLFTPHHLSERERDFLTDIMGCVKLSPKQHAWLQQIARKVEMKKWEGGDVQF